MHRRHGRDNGSHEGCRCDRTGWNARHRRLLRGVDDLDATVLRPARIIVRAADRALFAVADDLELRGRRTGGAQRALHRIAATLAEAEVVLARTALVRVA